MKLDNMASVNINDVVNMYQTLVKDWNKKPVNLEKCGKLLSSLKARKIFHLSSNLCCHIIRQNEGRRIINFFLPRLL